MLITRNMDLFTERKIEVREKVEALRNQIIDKYGDCPEIEVRFDLRGRCAGMAGRQSGIYYVRFNTDMMMNDSWDHIINSCVPHEVAHIWCYAFPRYGGKGHNDVWKRICVWLGGNAKRCHNEAVTKVKHHRQYEYVATCGSKVIITQTRHNKIHLKYASYTLTATGGKLDRTCQYRQVA